MSTKGALKQLKSVWGKAGLEATPGPEDAVGRLEDPRRGRKKSDRTAQLNLRIRPEGKERITLFAVRDRVSINECFPACSSSTRASTGALNSPPSALMDNAGGFRARAITPYTAPQCRVRRRWR